MGFAYYANFLAWFEVGRVEMLRALGVRYRDLEEGGMLLPVLEAGCRYLKPARYDDPLVVEIGVERRGRASVRFGYRVLRVESGEELLAVGFTEHCYLDREGRPMRPPSALTEALDRAPAAVGTTASD